MYLEYISKTKSWHQSRYFYSLALTSLFAFFFFSRIIFFSLPCISEKECCKWTSRHTMIKKHFTSTYLYLLCFSGDFFYSLCTCVHFCENAMFALSLWKSSEDYTFITFKKENFPCNFSRTKEGRQWHGSSKYSIYEVFNTTLHNVSADGTYTGKRNRLYESVLLSGKSLSNTQNFNVPHIYTLFVTISTIFYGLTHFHIL